MKTPIRVFLGILGIAPLVFSLTGIVAMLHDLATGDPFSRGDTALFTFLILLSIPAALAVFTAIKPPPVRSAHPESTEHLILHMARIHNGRVSPTHIAMQTPLTIDQATLALNELEQRQLVYSELALNGGTEFVFPDLLPPTTEFQQFDNRIAE